METKFSLKDESSVGRFVLMKHNLLVWLELEHHIDDTILFIDVINIIRDMVQPIERTPSYPTIIELMNLHTV